MGHQRHCAVGARWAPSELTQCTEAREAICDGQVMLGISVRVLVHLRTTVPTRPLKRLWVALVSDEKWLEMGHL
jgi:hypothetical protein